MIFSWIWQNISDLVNLIRTESLNFHDFFKYLTACFFQAAGVDQAGPEEVGGECDSRAGQNAARRGGRRVPRVASGRVRVQRCKHDAGRTSSKVWAERKHFFRKYETEIFYQRKKKLSILSSKFEFRALYKQNLAEKNFGVWIFSFLPSGCYSMCLKQYIYDFWTACLLYIWSLESFKIQMKALEIFSLIRTKIE